MIKYKIKDGLLDFWLTSKPGKFYTIISTSRGCPYDCIFYSSNIIRGRICRTRSPENIIEELSYLNSKFGVKKLILWKILLH